GCAETAATRNRRIRAAQADEIPRAGSGRDGPQSPDHIHRGPTRCDARGDPRGAADVCGADDDLARPQAAGLHAQKKRFTPPNNDGPTSRLSGVAGATGCRCATRGTTSLSMNAV